MIIRKEVFEKIGLLDKRYFLYFEDCDLCQRAKKAGFKIFYVPQAFLWHKNASSSGKPGSLIHQYYLTRNRFLFGFRYAPLRARAALIKESIKLIKAGGIKRRAIIDFHLRRFGGVDF
jgi:GT2 family glycosyltransferase